jgi:hypothetical protein
VREQVEGRRESWPGGKGKAWAVTPPCCGGRAAVPARVRARAEAARKQDAVLAGGRRRES